MEDPFAIKPGTPILPIHHGQGLGDLVARVAQPIARAIDGIFGTSIENCGGCARRREILNQAVPFAPATGQPASGPAPATPPPDSGEQPISPN